MKTYIEIKFEDHTYTATVTKFLELSKFLSEKNKPFKICSITGDTPSWLVTELNMISRFSKSKNVTATV